MTGWETISDPQKRAIRVIVPVTGTSTNSYVEVADLDTRWLTDTVIVVANTAAVNELDYKIEVYNDYASGKAFEPRSNTVAISDSDQIILVRHARVKISVKSTSSGNHTTYQVDCIAGRG